MSAASAVSKVAKPQLRGLLHDQIKRNLFISLGLCVLSGIAMKLTINNNRINKYGEFYRTYDIDKDFVRIKNLGLFDSCGPNS